MLRSLWRILEGLIRFSEGHDVSIICHFASLLWLKFIRGPVCTRPVLLVFDISGLVNPQFSITAVWASAPQVVGPFPPSKEFASTVHNQVHQQKIGAKETTQNIVEIPTVQVNALEIPEVQIVERIQEQIVVIIKVGPQERVQQRTVGQIGDVPVPQIQEQIEEVVTVNPKERSAWCARSEIYHKREYHFV